MKTNERKTKKAMLFGGLLLGSLLVVAALIGAMTGTATGAQGPAVGRGW